MSDFKFDDLTSENSVVNSNDNSFTMIVVIITVVLAIIIGVVVFLAASGVFSSNKKDEVNEVVKTEISTSESNVKILYSYVTYGVNGQRFDKLVTENNVTIDSFSDNEKFNYALMFMSLGDLKETGQVNNNVKTYYLSEANMDKYMKLFFGKDVTYSNNVHLEYPFDYGINGNNVATITYNTNRGYYEFNFNNKSSNTELNKYSYKLNKAYMDSEGNLELQEKIIYIDYSQNEDGTYNVTIYSDPTKSRMLETIYNKSLDDIKSNPVDIEKYIKYASTIKYNFGVNDDTYYFISSSIS